MIIRRLAKCEHCKNEAHHIDAFFRLITEYVYVLPHKLERAQGKIEITVDNTSVDDVVH